VVTFCNIGRLSKLIVKQMIRFQSLFTYQKKKEKDFNRSFWAHNSVYVFFKLGHIVLTPLNEHKLSL
jgi:hypothetical protein